MFEPCTSFTFLSFVEFLSAVLGQMLSDFEFFQTVVVIRFYDPFMLVNIARCPIPP